MEVDFAKISIDGKIHEVRPGKNLLEACLALGIDIPHFCFHPALGSVGACRLCAVKKFRDKNDSRGRIVMSCMESVIEGLIVSVNDPEAKSFRAAVIESLMTNHPHDCPVCDEGGECHLQDMTVMTGHNYRRFDFPKRTYNDQELGPFISHEMNRCIQCYRCVRYYRDYAGGKDLNVFGSRNHVYFGRHEDGPLESEFSGNLVEVCPTGVFTDKTLKKHFTRKWDLSNAPSVCVHCSLGCNTIASERYGSLRRIMSRYNGAVNGYFICDRGRFGYEFVNDPKRIGIAQIRQSKDSHLEPVDDEQLSSSLLKSISNNKKIIGIGSPRASLESNFALMSLAGRENFYHGISKKESLLTRTVVKFMQQSGVQTPSLKQMERADAVLILGEDLTNTAPMMALAVRQAARNAGYQEAKEKGIPLWNDAPVRELAQDGKSPVFIITPYRGSLDDIAEGTLRASPGEIADFGFSVAENLNIEPGTITWNENINELAHRVVYSLKNAKNPLIISGICCGDEAVLKSALNIAGTLHSMGSEVMLSIVLPECNSFGLSLLPGESLEEVFSLTEAGDIDTLVVLENDLYRRADEDPVNELFKRSGRLIVLDHLVNRTTLESDILLPAAAFAESQGTLVNNEGRAQRYYKAVDKGNRIRESWRWIRDLINIRHTENDVLWKGFDDIVQSLANEIPLFSKLKTYSPGADFRMLNAKIPRQTIRYSGRTAMNANVLVSEPGPVEDPDSPLAFSMEGQNENPPSSLVPFYWAQGWNSVQAMYYYLDEPGGSMKGGDPGIRLIEPTGPVENALFMPGENAMIPGSDELLIVPVFQIFGSDELSSAGGAVPEKIQKPFVLMNQKDADEISLKNGDQVHIGILKLSLILTVRIEDSLPRGVAGLSVNLPGMPYVDIPYAGKFHKI